MGATKTRFYFQLTKTNWPEFAKVLGSSCGESPILIYSAKKINASMENTCGEKFGLAPGHYFPTFKSTARRLARKRGQLKCLLFLICN